MNTDAETVTPLYFVRVEYTLKDGYSTLYVKALPGDRLSETDSLDRATFYGEKRDAQMVMNKHAAWLDTFGCHTATLRVMAMRMSETDVCVDI